MRSIKKEFKPTLKRTLGELATVKDAVVGKAKTDENGNNIITELNLQSIYVPIAKSFGILDKTNPMYPACEEDLNKLEEVVLTEDDKEENLDSNESKHPQCRVCLTELEDKAIKTECGHYFHKD
mmetsp:Transcript_13369/g.14995  ORF Transcript_13369/g.14995 Transcript_13369/m.14995 type:complete len:124 (+) Transcript_13369:297-668(+)